MPRGYEVSLVGSDGLPATYTDMLGMVMVAEPKQIYSWSPSYGLDLR
jgi:hypothetical protein